MFEFQTVRDVISFAISLEHVSQKFYLQLAEQVPEPAVHQFLLEMTREEAMHEEQLRSLVETDPDDLSGMIDASEIHSYVQAMEVPDELDYKKAVRIAYDKEKASQMLYTILSSLVGPEYIKQLLVALAKQEQQHKEFFAKEYDRICLGEN
ncbi:MAG: ferritin family protein [Phycisphaerae bacterium]|nr:ferritin family protein [Phycisphaerae bacterium]